MYFGLDVASKSTHIHLLSYKIQLFRIFKPQTPLHIIKA